MADALSSVPKLYTQTICPQAGEKQHHLDSETVEEICQLLRGSPLLGGIKLDRCKIEADSACALFECIGSLKQVSKVSLISFPMDEESFDAFASMLATSSHIEEIEIAGGQLSEGQIEMLAKAMCAHKAFKSFTFMANPLSNNSIDQLSQAIATHPDLRILKLGACGIGPDTAPKVLQAMHRLTSLSSLDLSKNNLHGSGVQALAETVQQLPHIKFLLLNQTGIKGNEDGEQIAKILTQNKIMALSLEDNFLQESPTPRNDAIGPIASALHRNPRLAKLSLNHCGLTPVGLNVLGSSIASNEGGASRLIHLDLGSNKLSSKSLPDLAGKKIRPLLANIPSLEELALEGCELGPESALHIAAGLAEFQGKQLTLKLSENRIKAEGYQHLREALSLMSGAAEIQLVETKQNYQFLLKLPDGSIRNDQEAKAMGLFQECVKFDLLSEKLAEGTCQMLNTMNKGELGGADLEALVHALEEVMEPITLMRNCREQGVLSPAEALLVQTCLSNQFLKEREKKDLTFTLRQLEKGKIEENELLNTFQVLHSRIEPIHLAKECLEKGLLDEQELEGVGKLLSKLRDGKLTQATRETLVLGLKEKLEESQA